MSRPGQLGPRGTCQLGPAAPPRQRPSPMLISLAARLGGRPRREPPTFPARSPLASHCCCEAPRPLPEPSPLPAPLPGAVQPTPPPPLPRPPARSLRPGEKVRATVGCGWPGSQDLDPACSHRTLRLTLASPSARCGLGPRVRLGGEQAPPPPGSRPGPFLLPSSHLPRRCSVPTRGPVGSHCRL